MSAPRPPKSSSGDVAPLKKTMVGLGQSAPLSPLSPSATVSHAGAGPMPSRSESTSGLSDTVLADAPLAPGELLGTSPTILGDAPSSRSTQDARSTWSPHVLPGATSSGRTAVLPRMGSAGEVAWSMDSARYERLQPLGEGGVGEVTLAHDRDIERKVAIKRLRPDQRTESSVLRFADEVRAVGQLEHPNIVPVHDVGLDEEGQHYLVMKFVQGETLESIIEKLTARDPAYVARFTHEHRARVFLSILHAIRYAHERGIIHRDIKPANIMVGPNGEVTVMDWGLAKNVRGDREPLSTSAASPQEPMSADATGKRLLETQQGALLGTPLYMSPEQAAGKVDELDERSDIYSLTVLLYELMTLEHPLASAKTVEELLTAIMTRKHTRAELVATALRVDAPCEYYHFMVKGFALNAAERYASIANMQHVLEAILNGKPPINCHITLTKRLGGEGLLWIDRHKVVFTLLFLGALAWSAWGVIAIVRATT